MSATTSGAVMIAETAIYGGASQKAGEFAALVEVVARLEPSVIVEIGSGEGGTLRAWKALAPDATLISVSLTGGPYGGGAVPAGLADHHLDLDSQKRETLHKVADILDGRLIDFLFIDGDHSYEGVHQDFYRYGWLVRHGGIIALHDITEHPRETGVAVHELWAELSERYKTVEFIESGSERGEGPWGGIGVVYL